MTKLYYQTADQTGEYLAAVEVDRDPVDEDRWLNPRGSVATPPPEVAAKEIPVWVNKEWVITEDHRGESGSPDGDSHEVRDLGPHPAGWSMTPPEAEDDLPTSVSNLAFAEAAIEAGIFPTAVDAQLDKIPDETERELAKVRWRKSRIALSDPLLQAQGSAMGKSSDELEAIYTRAVAIEAGG